jgi:hypothetical protein
MLWQSAMVSRSSTGPLEKNNISSQISKNFKNQNWWFFIDSNNYTILVQIVEMCGERLALRVSLNRYGVHCRRGILAEAKNCGKHV